MNSKIKITPQDGGLSFIIDGRNIDKTPISMAFFLPLSRVAEFLSAIQLSDANIVLSDTVISFRRHGGINTITAQWKGYQVVKELPPNLSQVMVCAITGWLNNLLVKGSLSLQ